MGARDDIATERELVELRTARLRNDELLGRQAAIAGRPASENPHLTQGGVLVGENARAWDAGWKLGAKEATPRSRTRLFRVDNKSNGNIFIVTAIDEEEAVRRIQSAARVTIENPVVTHLDSLCIGFAINEAEVGIAAAMVEDSHDDVMEDVLGEIVEEDLYFFTMYDGTIGFLHDIFVASGHEEAAKHMSASAERRAKVDA